MPESETNARGLALLGLRTRLALGFGVGVVAVLIISALTILAFRFNSDQQLALQRVNDQLVFAKDLDRAALLLQLASSRYVHLGYASERHHTFLLVEEWQRKMSGCEMKACLDPGQLKTVRKHLGEFLKMFELVAESRQMISDSLKQSFADIRSVIPKHSMSMSMSMSNPKSGFATADIYYAAINDHVSAIEAQLLAYFLSAEFTHVEAAERHLAELKAHLSPAHAASSAVLRGLDLDAFDVQELEGVLYTNIQRMRSYGYLVNVVMASHAKEMAYVANEVATEVAVEIASLRKSLAKSGDRFYHRLFAVIVLILLVTVPTFLWVLNSVTLPIQSLAVVFRRLAVGSEEDIVRPSRAQDEIADLYDAARAFREENVRERELLNDYKELSQNLEVQVATRTQQLRQKNEELDRLASFDKLTNSFNRRSLDVSLAEELARAQRYGRPLSVLMLDIDYFKAVNDEYGHLMGDRVLIALSNYVRASIRSSDVFGRWGGEEFLVICPETSLEQAQAVAEKVRSSVEQASFPIPQKVTISIGVSVCTMEDNAETLVAYADKALYRSKANGRNVVSI